MTIQEELPLQRTYLELWHLLRCTHSQNVLCFVFVLPEFSLSLLAQKVELNIY